MIHVLAENSFKIAHVSSGNFITCKDWQHIQRSINSYEIIYVLNGEVYIQEENVQYELKKDSILILRPGRVHFGYKKSEMDTSFFWLHFIVSDYLQLGLTAQYIPSTNGNFSELFKKLLHVAGSDQYPQYTADLMTALIINEIFILQKSEIQNQNKLVNEIAEWIRIHKNQPITLGSLAVYFKYSPNHLSHIFKNAYGVGIKEFINLTRMNYAKQLLLTENYSIKQISDIMNFNHENQFINFFKYHENISPTKYKNLYFNTHLNNDDEYKHKLPSAN